MRSAPLLATVLLSSAAAHALDPGEARHLLGRAGFSASKAEVEALAPLSREQAVDRLLAGIRTTPLTAPPAWVFDPPAPPAAEEARQDLKERQRARARELKAWWAEEMVATDSPLTEHLTLFFHGHFTSSLQKTRAPGLLYRQNALFRRHAGGSYAELLRAVVTDPAMILYLDGQTNERGRPNENFARELLELFTLGEGHYTEDDVKAAARAFTGIKVDRATGTTVRRPGLHDQGQKTFLGVTGDLDADRVVDVLLQQPRAATFLTEALWRELVDDAPDPLAVERLAAAFRAGGYQLKPLVRGLLLGPRFWSPQARLALVKSPVDVVVGALRTYDLHGKAPPPGRAVAALRRLGQDLFDPPNVKGWPGGQRWITATTLPLRQELAQRTARAARVDEAALLDPSWQLK